MENKKLEIPDLWDKLYPMMSLEDPDSGQITHYIYINTYFESPDKFTEVLALIDTVKKGELIIFKVNSGGGYLDSVLMIIDAIKACEAEAVCELSGTVASAATALALSCNDIYVAKHTTFMIHNFSAGSYGKGGEIEVHVNSMLTTYKGFFEDIYRPFLTKRELKKVINGKDLYLDADEVYRRFEKVKAKRLKQAQKQQEALEEEQHEALVAMVDAMGFDLTPKSQEEE